MKPSTSARKRTPTSIAWLSLVGWVGARSPKRLHGQLRLPPTRMLAEVAAPRLALSSVARAISVTWPAADGFQV